MSKQHGAPSIDLHDEDSNTSDNPHFQQVLSARLSRRSLLRGAVGSATTAVFGSLALSACGGGGDSTVPVTSTTGNERISSLTFTPVAKATADVLTVAAGYTARPIYALGDPLAAGLAAFKNDGTDTDMDRRAGDHHDGMAFFPLSAAGLPSSTANDRGLLAVNHEATTDETLSSFFLHANGGTMTLPRPAAEVDKEVAIHGLSVVEVRTTNAQWAYQQASSFNRRITPLTEVDITGPARGNALLVTKYSPDGTVTRGTLNNCGAGSTPWGTYVSGEENWNNYFTRSSSDDTARGDRSVVALNRYGRTQGTASRHGWETGGTADAYARWNISKTGTSADGSDDYRNELNGMGYVVELDPYNPNSRLKKRSALGRFAHESAVFSLPKAGQKLAVYMGCDSRNEYIYKFVTDATWSDADANPTDRLATGAKYLDQGKLYVAVFKADGSGEWKELSLATIPASYTTYTFADQGDVCVNARLAADAMGATKMDRPEWCSVHPVTGEVYFTLTNNSNRRASTTLTGSQVNVDAANPRAYTDIKGAATSQQGNVNGHILRLKEGAGESTATTFTWDVYLFGAEAGASSGFVNLSNLTSDQDFSSPDGLWFSPKTGICWIQTDDGAYTDTTNCMMLAGIPGQVGDGGSKTLNYGTVSVTTYAGKAPAADKLKRFLVGPKDCEITGICETPDGRTMFVNIQHPGESTKAADVADPSKYTSQWPANAGYGAGLRPRSTTIVITKNDGGVIGS
jgi:secreted PhoX family phosphatase